MSFNINFLRTQIKKFQNELDFKTAAFFSEKLVCVSENFEDRRTHCQVLYNCGREESVLVFLRQIGVIVDFEWIGKGEERELKFDKLCETLYFHAIAAKCSNKMEKYSDALVFLKEEVNSEKKIFKGIEGFLVNEEGNDLEKLKRAISMVCLERAKAHESQEKIKTSIKWYLKAVCYNPLCIEALQALVSRKLLTEEEKKMLYEDNFKTLKVIPCWLQKYFSYYLGEEREKGKEETKDINEGEDALIESKLNENSKDFIVLKARKLYENGKFKECLELAEKTIEERAGLDEEICLLYIYCLEATKDETKLFSFVQRVVDSYPKSTFSHFCGGIYSMKRQKFSEAKKYFLKCTKKGILEGPAWLSFGNALSSLLLSQNAISAYRSAKMVMPGCHLPNLYIAMEHMTAQNYPRAHTFLDISSSQCKKDPLLYNEIGVYFYKTEKLERALLFFKKALGLIEQNMYRFWEPLFFNMGHCYRLLGRYEKAQEIYSKCLIYTSEKSSVFMAIGMTLQAMGNYERAVHMYNKAELIEKDNFNASKLLNSIMPL